MFYNQFNATVKKSLILILHSKNFELTIDIINKLKTRIPLSVIEKNSYELTGLVSSSFHKRYLLCDFRRLSADILKATEMTQRAENKNILS